MGRRLLLVNVLILVGIIVLARYVTNAWYDFENTQNLASVLGPRPGGGTAPEAAVDVPPPPEPPQGYPIFTVIAEKDLFMAERRPAPPPNPEDVEKAPPLPKPPALNGVLNNGGEKQALIMVFEGNNPKGAPRQVSVGDDIQGWTVSEIADTTMTIRWKAEEKLIDMFDVSPQQQAAVPPRHTQAAPTVVTIGSAAAPVETTASAEAPGDERRGGLEVGVAGGQGGSGQRGPGQGMRSGDVGRGTLGGDTMRGGAGGMSGTGGPGTVGFPSSGTSSVPFTSGNRRRTGR